MSLKRPKAVVAVYLIVNKEDTTLLYLRQNSGYCDGMYSLIAGHVERGESISQAMIREAKEEAGIDITEDNLKPLLTMHRMADDERIDFFYELINWQGQILNIEPEKCKELAFFPLDNLPSNTIPYIKEALQSKERQPFCEFGWQSVENFCIK